MNLADKLANVDMTEDNRISDADRKYCETHQKAYELAIENLKGLIFYWECAEAEQDEILGDYDKETRNYSGYISLNDFSPSKVKEKVISAHYRFIRYVVNYFNKTYHIELDAETIKDSLISKKPEYEYVDRINYEKRLEEWESQMENMSLKYEDILDRVLIQLDGRTFTERAIDEVIENCRYYTWDDGEPYFEVKGDTIRLKDYYCSYTDWYSCDNWEMTSRMKSVIPAIYHYATGLYGDYQYSFARLFRRFSYPELDFNTEKLKSIKCFKNGRVDIKFASKTNASEFADKYLGWVAKGGISA